MDGNYGLEFIVILTILLVVLYLYGKRENVKKEKNIWKNLSKILGNVFGAKKINYRSLGPSGYQLSLSKPWKNIRKYEITIVMMDRENIIHYIIQKLQKKRDIMIIKMDFVKEINFGLNIYNVRWKKDEGGNVLEEASEIRYKVDGYGEKYLKMIKKTILRIKDNIIFISFSKSSPHLILTTYYDKDKVQNIIEFSKGISNII